jgi:hypothetical protein
MSLKELQTNLMNQKRTNLIFYALYIFEMWSHIFVYILNFCNDCWFVSGLWSLKKKLNIEILKYENEVKKLA